MGAGEWSIRAAFQKETTMPIGGTLVREKENPAPSQ
jgi:hypothetical protein